MFTANYNNHFNFGHEENEYRKKSPKQKKKEKEEQEFDQLLQEFAIIDERKKYIEENQIVSKNKKSKGKNKSKKNNKVKTLETKDENEWRYLREQELIFSIPFESFSSPIQTEETQTQLKESEENSEDEKMSYVEQELSDLDNECEISDKELALILTQKGTNLSEAFKKSNYPQTLEIQKANYPQTLEIQKANYPQTLEIQKAKRMEIEKIKEETIQTKIAALPPLVPPKYKWTMLKCFGMRTLDNQVVPLDQILQPPVTKLSKKPKKPKFGYYFFQNNETKGKLLTELTPQQKEEIDKEKIAKKKFLTEQKKRIEIINTIKRSAASQARQLAKKKVIKNGWTVSIFLQDDILEEEEQEKEEESENEKDEEDKTNQEEELDPFQAQLQQHFELRHSNIFNNFHNGNGTMDDLARLQSSKVVFL